MIDSILLGFVCGAWSFLWCGRLTAPGMLGNIIPALYWKVLGAYKPWKEYLSKPFFDCSICHSFWMAFFAVFYIQEPPNSIMLNMVVFVAALFSAFYLEKRYAE